MKSWPAPTVVELRSDPNEDIRPAICNWLNEHNLLISDIPEATPRRVGIELGWRGEVKAYFLDPKLAMLFKLTFANS